MKLVIGVDPHKQTHTAVAVQTGSGELAGERTAAVRPAGYRELLAWAQATGEDRLWALEDVRGVSRGLERFLLGMGERVVRVPPKLMAGARKSARAYGKSDSIDALAIARAALAHPDLPAATEDRRARDLQLLVSHRESLVRQRSESQDRLRWLLHAIEPDRRVPTGALDRKVWLDRVGRRLARLEQDAQVRIARDLVRRCRALTKDADLLERELALLVADYAPQLLELKGCGVLIAAKIIGETGGIARFRKRRPVCLPVRRRTDRRLLGAAAPPSAQPPRKPAAQLRAAQDRDRPGTLRRPRAHLPRTQANRRKEPPGSPPCAQAPPRSGRLPTAPGRAGPTPTDDQSPLREGPHAGARVRARSW